MTASTGTTQPQAIWSGWKIVVATTKASRDPFGRIKSRLEQKRNAQLWVIKRLRELAPEAVVGDLQVPGLQAAIDTLLDEIKQGFVGQEMQWRRNFAVAGLDRGRRQLKWAVDVPLPVIKLKQRGSPLTPANFADIRRFRRMRDALLNYLKANLEPVTDPAASHPLLGPTRTEVQTGVLLLCAVTFGAVANRSRLQRIAQCLASPSAIHVGARFIWVEWNEGGDGASDRWGRWIADPLSSLVIARYLAEQKQHGTGAAPATDDSWPALCAALAAIEVAKDDRPTSMRMLLAWAASWNYRYLPPFLAEYASGRLLSASLPPHAWRRLIDRRPVAFTPERQQSQVSQAHLGQPARGPASAGLTAREAALALRQLLRKGIQRRTFGAGAPLARDQRGQPKYPPKLAQVRTEVRHFAECPDVPMLVRLLADWVMSSVGRVQSKGASNRLTTILRNLEAIDYELSDEIGAEDILQLTGERRTEIYTRILERSRSAQRRNFRAASLARFHAYLAQNFAVDDDDLESIFDAVDVDGGVDANLVSQREFALLLDTLMHHRSEPRLGMARAIAACAGYRGMLRRGEARQAQRGDIRGSLAPQLRISPHRPDALKTHNAIRRIPFHDFMSVRERTLLGEYLRIIDIEWAEWLSESPGRDSEIDRSSAPLFASPVTPGTVLPDRHLFEPIVRALHEITGDRALRYHHLRHSGIHLLILSLLEQLLPGALSWLMPDVDPASGPLLRHALMGGDQLSKQELWAVAVVAGHSSPEVTLGSYFHLCDWLTYVARVSLAPALIDEDLARLTGLSHSNVRQLRRRLGLRAHEWFRLALHGRPEFNSLSAEPAEAPHLPAPTATPAPGHAQAAYQDSVKNPSELDLSSATAIVAMVAGLRKSPDSVRALSREHGVPAEIILKLGAAAEQLESVVGKSRGQRDRRGKAAGALVSLGIGALKLERPLRRRLAIHSYRQRECADLLFAALAIRATHDPDAFDEFATVYWRRRDFDDLSLRFGSRADASKVVGALRLLKSGAALAMLDEANLKFEHEAFVGRGAPPTDDQLTQWCEAVGIGRNQVVVAPREVTKPQGTEKLGYLRLSIEGQLNLRAGIASTSSATGARLAMALDSAMYAMTLRRLVGT